MSIYIRFQKPYPIKVSNKTQVITFPLLKERDFAGREKQNRLSHLPSFPSLQGEGQPLNKQKPRPFNG